MNLRQIVPMEIRIDSAGDGRFGASRDGGKRTHKGIDFVCVPGGEILSPVVGHVTKHGYPYGSDPRWRYIQVTDSAGDNHRIFYCYPAVSIGAWVDVGEIIGNAQDISIKYPGRGMLPHVHYEIKTALGQYKNPGIGVA